MLKETAWHETQTLLFEYIRKFTRIQANGEHVKKNNPNAFFIEEICETTFCVLFVD